MQVSLGPRSSHIIGCPALGPWLMQAPHTALATVTVQAISPPEDDTPPTHPEAIHHGMSTPGPL